MVGRRPDRPGTPALRYVAGSPLSAPLPPLPPARAADPAADAPTAFESPSWSPVRVAVPLFAAVWVCFAALAARATPPAGADVARLGHLLATGAAVLALVLITLSVAHVQVSGLWPRLAVVGVVALGVAQALVATAIASGPTDLWSIGGHVFELIGFAVPLAWVGGQFQRGVRRQRVERHASLTASWIEQARQRAHQTVQSVHRHDVRSMLFVIEGAARALADDKLSEEQREPFGQMLIESIERLGLLMDVRAEEIQPFAVDGVARAVAHAERKAGRKVTAELPAGLTAVGRAADVAAVLRTLVTAVGRHTPAVQMRGEAVGSTVVLSVEPAAAQPLPLLTGNWAEIREESLKNSLTGDEERVDLFVAARLLADQGADLWSTGEQARFAVRLRALADPSPEETV